MGIAPLLLTFGLLARPDWTLPSHLARWSGHHWSWTGTVTLGSVLLVWLAIQAALIGFRWPIQYVTAANGILILLFALIPSVQKFCAVK
jgi:hypothetical protein